MAEINVSGIENDGNWAMQVTVTDGGSSTNHTVTIKKEDKATLALDTSAEQLVKKSFEFLLERESKESIMSSFDIMVIAKYFPEYVSEIKKRLS